MNLDEQEKLRRRKWEVLKRVRATFQAWSERQPRAAKMHGLEFMPHRKFLEIYFFYEKDADVTEGELQGFSELIRQEMLRELAELQYPDFEPSRVRFVFDSHENVVKNYQGSYFFRLR